MLNILRRLAGEKRTAGQLYEAAVARAREPAFYSQLGVADTFDGRFDLVVLHVWLVLDALKQGGHPELEKRVLAAALLAFEDALRDQGAGDMSIGRRSKAMTSALLGRIKTYQAAHGDAALAEALQRNLYRDLPNRGNCAWTVAHYITEARKALADSDLVAGKVDFGAAPRATETTH